MTQQSGDEERFAELAEVYGWLKKDARDMLFDLLDGVSLLRSTANLLYVFAVIATAIGAVFVWGYVVSGGPGGPGLGTSFSVSLSVFLGILALFMFSVTVITSVTGFRYHLKYARLREKYSKLYESAKKLS